jgi:hypothetical protein
LHSNVFVALMKLRPTTKIFLRMRMDLVCDPDCSWTISETTVSPGVAALKSAEKIDLKDAVGSTDPPGGEETDSGAETPGSATPST